MSQETRTMLFLGAALAISVWLERERERAMLNLIDARILAHRCDCNLACGAPDEPPAWFASIVEAYAAKKTNIDAPAEPHQ